MAEKIGFKVKEREALEGGVMRIGVSLIRSSKTGTVGGTPLGRLGAGELPYILNTIRRSKYLNPTAHVGFTYTFREADGGFMMGHGYGFPYYFGANGFGFDRYPSEIS